MLNQGASSRTIDRQSDFDVRSGKLQSQPVVIDEELAVMSSGAGLFSILYVVLPEINGAQISQDVFLEINHGSFAFAVCQIPRFGIEQ